MKLTIDETELLNYLLFTIYNHLDNKTANGNYIANPTFVLTNEDKNHITILRNKLHK